MSVHPAAWIAWLTAVAVFVFVVSNPLYLVLALGAVLVVHISFPKTVSRAARAVRSFLVLGIVLLIVRVFFVALITNPGETIILILPRVEVPRWLGGFGLGGLVSAEVLVAAATDGLRLIVLLVAFGVFNAHADVASLVRTVPSVFRDAGLVVSIAMSFIPGMLRAARDVRDAQRLRGEKGRMLAPSLAVPIIGLGLERALLLAESMDARGYGRGETPRLARGVLWSGLAAIVVGMGIWAGGYRTAGAVLIASGGAAIVWSLRTASRLSPVTRLATRSVDVFDAVIIGASSVACAFVVLAGPAAAFDPYPAVHMPTFSVRVAAISFLLTLPAAAGAEAAR